MFNHFNNCKKCDLCGSNLVVYRGNTKAKIVVVGMGPGKDEEACGSPFVGKAGIEANKMFSYIGLDPNKDLFWTNVIFHRTKVDGITKDRAPTLKEALSCRPNLIEVLEYVNPEIIIALGKPTVESLLLKELDKPWMKDYCNTLNRIKIGIKVWPVFYMLHPAYWLRNPKEKPFAVKCIDNFKTILKDKNII